MWVGGISSPSVHRTPAMTSIPATVPDGLIECARELLHWTVADTLEELQAQVASALQTITRCNCLQAARATEIVVAQEFSG
jgi:hypothetical protein